MCGRFVNLNNIKKLTNIFDIKNNDQFTQNQSYNISPSQFSTIITNNNIFEFDNAYWGFNFFSKNDDTYKTVINSRIETINEKILFKDSYLKRKCIIPTNGYFEWFKINNKSTPFFIHLPYADTIFLAGIWKYSDNNKIFSIITKPANNELNKIHDRMPILFSQNEANLFLTNTNYQISLNFISEIEDDLDYFEVSSFVNNPKNNSKKCIQSLK